MFLYAYHYHSIKEFNLHVVVSLIMIVFVRVSKSIRIVFVNMMWSSTLGSGLCEMKPKILFELFLS